MIVLSKEQIEEMVDPDQMMDQIEEAYRIYGSGEFYMPPRPTVEHENKQLMYMPCYTKDIIGTKILSIFPENSKLGLPSIDGIVLLNDYTTGAPLAVMDGQSVTAWRTGAVGGVGIRHLSRKDCRTVGIIGAGMQGFHQAVYAGKAGPAGDPLGQGPVSGPVLRGRQRGGTGAGAAGVLPEVPGL